MPSIADLVRDSSLAKRMFGARYGEADPYVLAVQQAQQLGYPAPGAESDVGEAQRYQSSKLAAERYGILPLLTNPIHEALLSWGAEGENGPNIKRLDAGYRGVHDAFKDKFKDRPNSLASLLAVALGR